MKKRAHAVLALATTVTLMFGASSYLTQPAAIASQAPVDRSGLDVLCSGKGDVYSPPSRGVSTCIFADGQVMTCDAKSGECQVKRDVKSDSSISPDAMTLRMLKQLNDKVDALSAQVRALSAAKK